MYFKFTSNQLRKRANTLIPDLVQLTTTRFVNYLTMDVSKTDNSWGHMPKILNSEHALAMAYLQANFKNHLTNLQGISRIKEQAQMLDNDDSGEFVGELLPEAEHRKFEKDKKIYYIYEENYDQNQLMQCEFMANRNINKILVFPKSRPLGVNPAFEKFCFESSIRALGLTDFSLRSLMYQISKSTSMTTLVHEIPDNNAMDVYREDVPGRSIDEIIMFSRRVLSRKIVNTNFLSFKDFLQNYKLNDPFENQAMTTTEDFKISRFQNLANAKQYHRSINQQLIAQEPDEK